MSRYAANGRPLVRNLTQLVSRPNPTPQTGASQWSRAFSQSTAKRADEANRQPPSVATRTTAPASSNAPLQRSSLLSNVASPSSASSSSIMGNLAQSVLGKATNTVPRYDSSALADEVGLEDEELTKGCWHFHIYSHKHNTHVTVTKPNRDPIISLSCGNLGFKKSGRKHYDSAYQLGAYVLDRLYQSPHAKKIKNLEVVLRGFGPGREAVVKVLLGSEGKWLRDAIRRVADSTRLKFGGTRSKKPRRLG